MKLAGVAGDSERLFRMTEYLANHAKEILESWSYFGAFVLMLLESMIAPVPSEVVMTPLGMLVAQNKLSLWMVVAASSAGSIAGSLISYAMGAWGGKPLVLKFGKYLLLNEHHLEWTEKWFHKHGDSTIFIGRFIPVVRHLISIPAGVGRMPLPQFCIFTLLGATLWNGFLLWLGMKLQDNWTSILKWRHMIDVGVVIVLVVGGGWFFYTHLWLPAKQSKK